MDTDTTAYSGKGIPFPDDFYRFVILATGNGSHVIGHINAGRTGMLAGGNNHRIARGPGTSVLQDMVLIFLQEVFEGGKGGLGSGLSETAEG